MPLSDLIDMNQVLYLTEHASHFWAIFPDHRLAESGQPKPDEDLPMSPGASNTTTNQGDFELRHCFTPRSIRVLAARRRVPARAYERPPEARECAQALTM